MSFWDLLFLAVIQGIAEFLPISSSGHLVLAAHWLGIHEATGTLTIMLHAGTLLSILVFYFSRILSLVKEDRRVIPLLVVGTLPAGVVGILLKRNFESLLENPWVAASMLLVTGGILMATRFIPSRVGSDYRHASYGTALFVGFFQAFAILPGISRSGSTIFAGHWIGLSRESAATFSFLLAIPVILGATLLEIKDLWGQEGAGSVGALMLILGATISFGVGYVSLVWLVAFIQKGKFHLFAWWCIPFGLVTLLILSFSS